MTKRYYSIVALVIIAWISPNLCQTQDSWKEDNKLTLNLDNAPMRIRFSYDQDYIRVENRSSKAVKSYRLGCAVREEEKVSAKCAFDVHYIELKPLELPDGLSFEAFGTEQSGLAYCQQTSTKLTVVEVLFSDDSVWKIEESDIPWTNLENKYCPCRPAPSLDFK